MSRSPVTLREASPADAPRLVVLWSDVVRRAEPAEQLADVEAVIADAASRPDQRLVVAEHDGQVAGAVLLRAATVSPLNLEPIVQAVSPHVLPEFRRRGIGLALMEAAAVFAEEQGIGHVGTASLSNSRDANRFMARLGLGPQAVLRATTTPILRARLAAQRPALGAARSRHIGQVLAARRSQRNRGAPPVRETPV